MAEFKKEECNIQKYPKNTTFISVDNIVYRVIDYEKTLYVDGDDHYKVCFDEESNLSGWTKQSYLDKMKIKK